MVQQVVDSIDFFCFCCCSQNIENEERNLGQWREKKRTAIFLNGTNVLIQNIQLDFLISMSTPNEFSARLFYFYTSLIFVLKIGVLRNFTSDKFHTRWNDQLFFYLLYFSLKHATSSVHRALVWNFNNSPFLWYGCNWVFTDNVKWSWVALFIM